MFNTPPDTLSVTVDLATHRNPQLILTCSDTRPGCYGVGALAALTEGLGFLSAMLVQTGLPVARVKQEFHRLLELAIDEYTSNVEPPN